MEDKLGTAAQMLDQAFSCGGEIILYMVYSLGLGKGHPEDEDKLEDVVEGYSDRSASSSN